MEGLYALQGNNTQWKSFREAKANWPGPDTEDGFFAAELAAKLKRLYEIRDLLGSFEAQRAI